MAALYHFNRWSTKKLKNALKYTWHFPSTRIPLSEGVCGLLCWNEGLDWNLRMSAFADPNEIKRAVNWCNKSSELSRDVLLKAVKGCPSNHPVRWLDAIKGAERQWLRCMEANRAGMTAAFIQLSRSWFYNTGSAFPWYILLWAPTCTVTVKQDSSSSYKTTLLLFSIPCGSIGLSKSFSCSPNTQEVS